MPPRAGKGARGEGRAPAAARRARPSAFDSINWASSRREWALQGVRPTEIKGKTASPGSGLGGGGGTPPTAPGPAPPRRRRTGWGLEEAVNSAAPSKFLLRPQHTLRRADPAPGLGWARVPTTTTPPLRVRARVALVPGSWLVYEHPISHR